MTMAPQDRLRFLTGLLAQSLAAYEDGASDLASLVNDVESVIESLFEVADADWVAELRSTWFKLEVIYAVALDEDRSTLDEDERRDVDKIVGELRSVLGARTPLC